MRPEAPSRGGHPAYNISSNGKEFRDANPSAARTNAFEKWRLQAN